MPDVVVLTEQQVGQLIYKDQFARATLVPARLTDGRYILPLSALTQPEHARFRPILKAGSVEDLGTLTIDTSRNGYYLTVPGDDTLMGLYIGGATPASFGYPAPALFDIPADGLWRFECRRNNDPASPDRAGYRRRTEMLQNDPNGYQADDTIWASWSMTITDQRDGFDANALTLVQQWHQHPSSAIRPPPMAFVLDSGVLSLVNRSANGAASTTLWSQSAPASWQVISFVMQCKIGTDGFVKLWVDGSPVVDVSTNVGYTLESLPYLIRMQWGIYMDNTYTVDALYHANVEFGTSSLYSRVDFPLAINTPPDGWPVTYTGRTLLYPDTTLYPDATLYPA